MSAVAAILKTYVTAVGSGHNAYAHLQWLKLNFVNADDSYTTPDTPVTYDIVPEAVGGSGQGPFQLALAVSTMTAAPRGLASKGRFFIPAGSQFSIDANGQFPIAAADLVNSTTATMLTALKAAGFTPEVYSVKGLTGRPIIRTRVGRVLDTQRRRRRSVPEAYVLGTAF